MTEDDPFFVPADPGATVVRPMPGGRRPGAAPGSPPAPPPLAAPPPLPPAGPASGAGATPPPALPAGFADNPLVHCATDLLTVAGQLRGSLSHPDPAALRERLIRRIRDFEQCARARGLAEQVVLPARYVLCALLDESVKDTPWGSQSLWAEHGLLIAFHNETWGGEKFFDALERLLAYPAGHRDLLELMYLCLAMGFEGRYRVRDGGREQLERVREQVYQAVRAQRAEPDADLSPHWRGLSPQRDPLIHQLPLWVFAGIAALALLGLFAAYTFWLGARSDPVYLDLAALDKRLPAMPERVVAPIQRYEPPPAETPPVPRKTLRGLLADDIAADRVAILDRPDGETLVIRGEGLFASASATLTPGFVPLIRRIGAALAQVPGPVLVTGHSDSAPIKTLRFPSNFHLSQARAESVEAMLAEVTGEPARFTAEGRADTEPLVPENPRDARNRRVEILLTGRHGGSGLAEPPGTPR